VRVDDTCSGLQSACALLMLALVAGHLRRVPPLRTLLLVAAVLPLGLLVNGARIAFLLLVGVFLGIEWAEGLTHDLSAVVFFAAAYVGIFWAARRLAAPRRADQAVTPMEAQTAQENTSPTA